MGQLRQRMEADLKIGGYNLSTQKVYLCYARKFAAHFIRSPAVIGNDEIQPAPYGHTLRDDRKPLCVNQEVAAARHCVKRAELSLPKLPF